jgi:hypothetical protein
MQIKRLIGAAAAVTAATIIAGTASTAGNTVPANGVAGYGQVTVSGLAVSNVAYVVDSADASKLESIVFTTKDLANAKDSKGQLTTNASTSDCNAPVLNDQATVDTADDTYTFTCLRSVAITAVSTVGFTATKAGTAA